jgi:hypothetical protein
MERVLFNDRKRINAITSSPDGPESLIFGLRRFPFVSVDKLTVLDSTYQDLQGKMRLVGAELGHQPLTAVFCNAGLYRSKLIARHLREDQLVELSKANLTPRAAEVVGRGKEFISYAGLGFSDQGLVVYDNDPRTLEALVLTLADQFGSRETLTKIAAILDQGLPSVTKPRTPLSIIWLNGDEDSYDKWLPNQT